MTENLYTPNCIRTYSDIYINPFNPLPEKINIEDIAHSLSMQCRFAGHLPKFYSVAQHSVQCSFMVAPKFKLQALLHDASEAYLLDIPSPVKNLIPFYKQAENKLMDMIADKFGFTYPLQEPVEAADKQMLQFEWDYIMLRKPLFDNTWDIQWPQNYAKTRFLAEYYKLTEQNLQSQ